MFGCRPCCLALCGVHSALADELQRLAKLPVRAVEKRFGCIEIASVQQHDGNLDTAACIAKCIARFFAITTCEPDEHVLASSQQFFVACLDVDHQPPIHPSKENHQKRGDKVELNLLCCPCEETCGPGNRLRAGVEPNRMIRLL